MPDREEARLVRYPHYESGARRCMHDMHHASSSTVDSVLLRGGEEGACLLPARLSPAIHFMILSCPPYH